MVAVTRFGAIVVDTTGGKKQLDEVREIHAELTQHLTNVNGSWINSKETDMRSCKFQNSMIGLACTTLLAIPASVALAGETTPTPQQSRDARLAQLEKEVAALRSQNSEVWLRDDQQEQIQALIADALSDAQQRTSLLGAAGSAGWDKGFYLSSDDGAFKLKITGQVQARAVWNNRDDSGGDDSIFGFEMRRVKLGFGGNLCSKDFTYKVKGAFSRKSGTFALEDAWGAYKLNDTMKIKWGQFKAPFLREELTSSSKQVAVDRSYVTELTTLNFSQGVGLVWAQDKVRGTFMFNEGAPISMTGDNGSGANTAFAADGNEWAATGRVEFLALGEDWGQFKDYTSWSDDEDGVLIGAALHYQKDEREDGPPDTDTDVFGWTVDASVEFGGAHVEAYVVGLSSDNNTAGTADFDQVGYAITGGVFLDPDKLELFGRWEHYDFDGAAAAGYNNEIDLFTVGANYYFHGHNAKWTTDVIFAGDPVPDGSSGLGIEKDAADQDGQFVFRTQMQFLF